MGKIPFENFRDKSYYPHQLQALDFIKSSSKRFVCLNAPTGSGKSLIAMSLGTDSNSILILCSSKILQDQYTRDFPEAELLKGRNNYGCNFLSYSNPEATAEDCVGKKRCPPGARLMCEYRRQKEKVLCSHYRILNYHYYLTECNGPGRFSGNPIVICDEADLIEKILADHITFKISGNTLRKYGRPKKKTKLYAFHEWLIEISGKIKDEIKRVELELDEDLELDLSLARKYRYLKGLYTKVQFLCSDLDPNWLLELHQDKALELKPVWLTPALINRFLFRHARRWVFMSATLPPKEIFCGLMHIDPNDCDYLELPHTFPLENRLIYYHPVVDITYSTLDDIGIQRLGNAIIKLIQTHHPKGRGIIHTVSYSLSHKLEDYLYQGPSDITDRLIFHNHTDKNKALRQYYDHPNAILISPSCERGLDLHDDLGEFAIWCKAPYLSLADKQVNQRVYASGRWGNLWYRSVAAMSIVQGAGRIVRHKKDKGITYLLDKQIGRLLKSSYLWPKWFREAVVVL